MDRRKLLLTALAIILVAGFLLRLFPIRGGYHYWDETVYLQHGEILTGESPDNYNEFEFRPPLFSLILAGTFLISSSILSAHLIVSGISSLAIIIIYIIGKELYTEKTGLIAATIYAISPLGIILSHDILVDPILPVLWLLTAFSLIKALRTDRNIYYISTGFMAALAVLMKFTSLVIMLSVFLVLIVSWFRKGRFRKECLKDIKEFSISKNNWLLVISFLIGIIPYLLWSFLEFGSPFHVFLVAWIKSGASDPFLTYLKGWRLYLLAPLYLGFAVFFWKSDIRKLENYLPVIFFLSLYLPLQFLVGNKETRFLMPVLPFFVLVVAEGLRKLRSENIFHSENLSKSIFAFLIITSILILPTSMPERNVFAQGATIEWEAPVKDAGEWLKENTDEDSVIYTNYQYPALGYYSKRDIVWFREYEPLEKVLGEEINSSGYLYYSKESSYPYPKMEELETDQRFQLNKTFENTSYLFYFKGA